MELLIPLVASARSNWGSRESSQRARQRPETCVRDQGATDMQRFSSCSLQRRMPHLCTGFLDHPPTTDGGTAEIVYYGITQGEKGSMGAAGMAKGQQVVEAVLRDKDPEWFQAQGTGKHFNQERTTQRAKHGSGATRTIRRARATRHVRAQRDGVTQESKSNCI